MRHPTCQPEIVHRTTHLGRVLTGSRRPLPRRCSGFTLIELILVMSMMLIILSLIGPSLSGFFRGRTLDSEARRFLALTRFAQSRAVSEGMPMLLWIDVTSRRFGVESEFSYSGLDEQAKEFSLSETLEIEVGKSSNPNPSPAGNSGLGKSAGTLGVNLGAGRNGLQIRFAPDGSISETSPDLITLREAPRPGEGPNSQGSTTYIGQSLNRLHYEIRTNHLASLRR